MIEPLDVFVLQHTHWDREWYHPAGRFRQRLVALIDELLDDATAGAPFLLDGQAVVLDDYLAVRPDRRESLAAALGGGALEAGPWYVLADGLIPSGEALVRNLLAGRRALAALGATAPPVLYAPDAFGHAAALPALAAGFGCAMTIVWRGYGGARWPAGDAAWWRAPSGERTLLWHLPRDGYELGSSLPADPVAAAERWARMRPELADRARLGLTLVQNGADHHARQARWAEALAALRRAAEPEPVRQTSLTAFAGEARRRADAAELPTVAGELRDSYGYAWTLQGTFASRTPQKRRNAQAQRLLERDVEPWLALHHLRGGADDGARSLLGAAWRTLLLCHPHDTLCGCSTDEVARAAHARWDDVIGQGRGLREDAIAALLNHDANAARERREAWQPCVVVRNRAARARGGVAEVTLTSFVRDVAVGPGSAGRWHPVAPLGATPSVLDDGGSLALQVLHRTLRHERTEAPRHYPDDDIVEAARALVWVPPIGGLALRAYPLGTSPSPDASPPSVVRTSGTTIENERLSVRVDQRGRVAVRSGGVEIESLLSFEDVGDGGDLYTHSAVGEPIRTVRCAGVRVVHRGPLRGEVEARYRLRVPVALDPSPDGFSRPTRRASRHVDLALVVHLSVDADAAFVRVRVRGENRARDHRLRILFGTALVAPRVLADAAFGAVERVPPNVPAADAAVERPTSAAPLHRWVASTDGARTLTLISDGLGEYEALSSGELAVTLVRAVSELSRPDLPERPGHAGWPVTTPEAQLLGPFEADFAVALSPGSPDVATIERMADDVLLPLCGTTFRSALSLPAPVRGIGLEGDGLTISAITPSDDGEGIVLRCVNATDRAVDGGWLLPAAPMTARVARLDETSGDAVAVERLDETTSRIPLHAGPRMIVTVIVRRAPSS